MRFYNMRRVLFFVLLLIIYMPAMAQNDGNRSMYWAVPTEFNPSMAGCDSAMHVSASNRQQWVGVENAPQTSFISADMPFKFRGIRQGVGVSILNDQAGLFSTTITSGQYSYSKTVWGGRLALGAQLGMINQKFDAGGIYIPDGDAWNPSDEALPSGDVSGTSLDLGLGAYFEKNFAGSTYYAALSLMHLNQATIDLEEYAYYQQKRTYYFLAGGNIPLTRTLFILQPSLLVKSILQTTQVDVTLRATYDNRFFGGLSYRHGDAIVLMAGAEIKSIRLGYSYDIGTSALARASNGSHEIVMSYLVKMDLDKNKKHPKKSIRIL